MFPKALAVFFGGAFGALFRFLLSEFFPLSRWGIPFTIIFINFAGCFIMGAADAFFDKDSSGSHLKHFVVIGLLGGFTTFSSFSLEFSNLMRDNNIIGSFAYVAISVIMALSGFWFGYMLVKSIK